MIADGIVDVRNGVKMIRTIIPGMNENFFLPNYFLPFTLAAKAYTGFNPFTKSDKGFSTDEIDSFTDQFLGFSFMAIDPTFEISRLSNDSKCTSTTNSNATTISNDCNDTSTSTSNLKMIHGIINIDVETVEIGESNITIVAETNITSYTGSGYKPTARFHKAPPFELFSSNTIKKDEEYIKLEGGKTVKILNQTVGGVRIDFEDEFEGIPTGTFVARFLYLMCPIFLSLFKLISFVLF